MTRAGSSTVGASSSVEYAAKTWPHARHVIVKAEHGSKGANPRFVVTTLTDLPLRLIYEKGYCARGQCENFIKDFKNALNADRLSSFKYWQFWRDNTADEDVGRFLKLFTDLPIGEIDRLSGLQGAELNEARKILADETTTLLHGREEALRANEAARIVYEEGGVSGDLPTKEIETVPSPSEISTGTNEQWQYGRSNTAILFASGLVSSNREARQKIAEGAVRINDRLINDPYEIVPWSQVDPRVGAFKVQLGKKRIVLVKPKP